MDNAALLDQRKALVKGTWKAVEDSLGVEATKLFYKRLFEKVSISLNFVLVLHMYVSEIHSHLSLTNAQFYSVSRCSSSIPKSRYGPTSKQIA